MSLLSYGLVVHVHVHCTQCVCVCACPWLEGLGFCGLYILYKTLTETTLETVPILYDDLCL